MIKNTELRSDFFFKYAKVFDGVKKHYYLKSFEQIGMQDPFPTDKNNFDFSKGLPEDHNDLTYHESRFMDDNSPKCLYLPSRFVMFKIMRACVDVTKVDELWFMHPEWHMFHDHGDDQQQEEKKEEKK